MTSTHDCITNNCSGTRYDGANFTCNRCLKPSYVECNANRPEVIQLISAINKDTTINNNNRLQNKIKTIINQESVFEFTCQQCKATGSYTDNMTQQIEKEKKTIEKQNEKSKERYKIKIKELEEEIKTQKQKINELEIINARMNQKILDGEDNNMQIDTEQDTLEIEGKLTDMYN